MTRTVCVAVAVVTLGLTAFYAAHVYYFLARRIADRELMLSFMGLAVFFLAVTIPLVLSREWITVSWAIQALVMLWLADKLKSAFLRQVAFLLYGLVLLRFGFFDLPAPVLAAVAGGRRSSRRLPAAPARAIRRLRRADRLDRGGLFPAQVAACAGPVVGRRGQRRTPVAAHAMGPAVLDHPRRRNGVPLPAPRVEPQPGLSVRARAGCRCSPCSGLGCAFSSCTNTWPATVRPFWPCWRFSSPGVLGKLVFFDLPFWGLEESFVYGGSYSFLDALMRLVDFGAMVAFFVLGVLLARRGQARPPTSPSWPAGSRFP